MKNFTAQERFSAQQYLKISLPADDDGVTELSWKALHDTRSDVRKATGALLDWAKKDNRDLTAAEEGAFDVGEKFLDQIAEEFDRRSVAGIKEPSGDDKPYKVTMRSQTMQKSKNIIDHLVRGEELPPEYRSLAVGTGTQGGVFLSEPAAAAGFDFQNTGLLSKCLRTQTEQNATTLMVASFMESDWRTSGPYGVAFASTPENAPITESDLSAHGIRFEVNMLAALVSASRLFFDSNVGAAQNVAQAFNSNLKWKIDQQICSGSGISQFLGFMNAGCAINVSRASANDITLADILNMKKSALPYSPQNYLWIASPGAFSKILDLEDSAGHNVFIPPAANSPEYRLLGHEIYVSDHASAVGIRGDLALVDLSLYQVVEFGFPRLDVSKEVMFNSDKVAIKMVYFADAKSLMRNKVTTTAGDLSHIVVLQVNPPVKEKR